jgi:hypothetical protein
MDVHELLLHLVRVKGLYLQLMNRNFGINKNVHVRLRRRRRINIVELAKELRRKKQIYDLKILNIKR